MSPISALAFRPSGWARSCALCPVTKVIVVDLVQEIVNARVWGGIHYRESVVKGVNIGRKVAHWTLQRYFLTEN